MSAILARLPRRAQVISVYGIIAIVIYTWTLMRFFWKLPSWLYFLNGGEVLTALAYLLVVNLLESLAFLCGPLFLALVLPRQWFRDVFVARGAALSLAGLGCMMVLAEQFNNFNDYPTLALPLWPVLLALIGIAVVVYFSGKIGGLRRVLEIFADRVSIFAYVLTPLSLLSVLLVVIHSALG
jgi:hypothetical protein